MRQSSRQFYSVVLLLLRILGIMTILGKYLAAMTMAVAVWVGLPTIARALTIGDAQELGFVNFGIPSGDADRTLYVNHLIGMSLGATDLADGQTYTCSNNVFSPLPTAVFSLNGTSTTIDLGTGLYTYLFAKYDGPNYGSEVWYVGNLSGIITIPATGGQYGLSGWTLFDPTGTTVPDGGTTVMLLGAALGTLGMARRFVKQ